MCVCFDVYIFAKTYTLYYMRSKSNKATGVLSGRGSTSLLKLIQHLYEG